MILGILVFFSLLAGLFLTAAFFILLWSREPESQPKTQAEAEVWYEYAAPVYVPDDIEELLSEDEEEIKRRIARIEAKPTPAPLRRYEERRSANSRTSGETNILLEIQ